MEKNEIYTVKITDLTTDGEGIGRIFSAAGDECESMPLFVKNAVIGDTCEVSVMKVMKNRAYARLLKVIEPSKDRVTPMCDKAVPCGGCQLQMMDYEAQLEYKTRQVTEALKRIGGFENPDVKPCIGMENPVRYRNKAQVPVGFSKDKRVITGFYASHSHNIIESDDCLLTPSEVPEILKAVKEYMQETRTAPYDELTGRGKIRHILVRKGFSTGEIMVCIVSTDSKLKDNYRLLEKLKEIKGFVTLCLNINRSIGNVILGPETQTLFGPGYITDCIGDTAFRISANSFYQVNPVQTKVLYDKVLEFAGLTGNETVWDLYSGIGTISLFLAKKAKKVFGVEIVPQAVENARDNAKLNHIENTEFFLGKAEEVLPDWYKKNIDGKIDAVVVDPPRKGLDGVCINTILKIRPEKIVYVSCDYATLARDLKLLCEKNYILKEVQPVDQFCMCTAVETVCLLTRREK